jgi:hypothetical protein
MASVEPEHVSMAEKPVDGTPVPDAGADDAGAGAGKQKKKGGIDAVSKGFDNMALKMGKAYGRAANRSPLGCCCLGLFILILGTLPFLYESGRGRRSNVNRGQGVVFRTDYGMWSPASSHQVSIGYLAIIRGCL